jgi:hypothetical protein
MAILVEMGVAPYPGRYPLVKIMDRDDAKTLVDILLKNGIPVNLREVSDTYGEGYGIKEPDVVPLGQSSMKDV